jgi:hypothetical protein
MRFTSRFNIVPKDRLAHFKSVQPRHELWSTHPTHQDYDKNNSSGIIQLIDLAFLANQSWGAAKR